MLMLNEPAQQLQQLCSDPKQERRAVTISPELWQFAKDLGEGNASAGIRIALRTIKQSLRSQKQDQS
jgi:hypothetical protein